MTINIVTLIDYIPPLISLKTMQSGDSQLKIHDQIFKIKFCDQKHRSLTKKMNALEKQTFINQHISHIDQCINHFFETQKIDASKTIVKKMNLVLSPTQESIHAVFENSNDHKKYEKIFVSKPDLANQPLLENSKSKESLIVEIQNATPKKGKRFITKVSTDLIRLIFGKNSKFDANFVKKLNQPSEVVHENMLKINGEERFFFSYLDQIVDWTHLDRNLILTEIVNGAYVSFEDEGQIYEDLKEHLESKEKRYSSHQSDHFDQYSIQGKLVREMLFSKKIITLPDGSKKQVSWFQCERYQVKTGEFFCHMGTWFLYKMRGKNQGPLGESIHTENRNPLVLPLRQLTMPIGHS